MQGNALFGPLPVELDPVTLEEAGGESIIHPAGSTPLLPVEGRMVDELGGERSMRRRGRVGGVSEEREGEDYEAENEFVEGEDGEGSAMDIEDD